MLQNRKLLVGLLCLTASTTWLVETAHADRRTSLGGNLLIKDPDDVFPFPQYAVMHRNMIRLDYGGNSGSGNGVLTLGNENHAFGLALHRGDLLNPDIVGYNTELTYLSGVQDPFTGAAAGAFSGPAIPQLGVAARPVAPATVFDLMYGTTMGANALGFRVGLGRGIQAINADGETTKGQQTFVVGQVGYSLLPAQGLKLDLSGNVSLAFANSTGLDGSGDEEDLNSGIRVRAGFLGRGYIPLNNIVDIGFLAQASFTNEHVKDDVADVKGNDFNVGLMGGIGPVVNLERAKIAAYGGFMGSIGKSDPDTDEDEDAGKSLQFLVPMVNMAAEVQVLDWLFVRTGTQYSWNIDRLRDTADDPTKLRASTGAFAWTAGVGLAKNNFAFDGVVKNGFVTGGPNFIGGYADGFLAMASMTYKFGDVFSTASTTPVESVPAEPVPAEPVQPEPVVPAPAPEFAPPPPPEAPVEGSINGASPNGGVNVGGTVGGTVGTP